MRSSTLASSEPSRWHGTVSVDVLRVFYPCPNVHFASSRVCVGAQIALVEAHGGQWLNPALVQA